MSAAAPVRVASPGGWQVFAGSVYQAELQRALTARLGVVWGPDRHGTKEIDGFSRDQSRVFSKRTVQIEAELAAVGADQLVDSGQRARADDAASLATRVAKNRGLAPARLVGRWEAEAADAGLAVGRALDERVSFRERTAGPLGYAAPPICSQTYGEGSVVELTATPTSTSTFRGWTGACSGTGTCIVTLDGDKTVTALFDARLTVAVISQRRTYSYECGNAFHRRPA